MILTKVKRFLLGLLCMAMMIASVPCEAFANPVADDLQQNAPIENVLEDDQQIEESQSEDLLEQESEKQELLSNEPILTGAENSGSFVLAVFSQNVVVIEPVKVAYEAGETVKDALVKSGYTFTGIENGFIQAVEDVSGNYSISFADGGFALDTPADKVGTMFISERTDVNITSKPELVAAVSEALKTMEAFNSAINNVQKYEKAADAYKTVLTNMRTGDAETIAANTTALNNAVKEYEDVLAGGKRKITVNVTQGGVAVNDAHLKFTDEYGNVTTAIGNEIELLDGKYVVVVTDSHNPYNYSTNVGRMNATAGGNWYDVNNYFIVGEDTTTLNVKLASGEWFGPISGQANSSNALNASLSEIDYGTHKATFYLADNFSGNVKPTIYKADGTPDKAKDGTLSSRTIMPWVDFIYATGDNAGKWVSDVATTANTCSMSFGSARTCLNFVDYGMTGNTFYTDIRWLDDTEADATNFIVKQSFEMEVKRFPTFASIDVKDVNGSSLISTFDPFTYSYDVTTIAENFTVDATPFAENYNVSIIAGDNTVIDGNKVTLTGENGSILVVVETQGVSTAYKVNLTKVSAVDVTLSMEDGVTAQIFNVSGSLIAPKEENGNVYALVPNETYTYISTKEVHYHATANFTALADLTIDVATPEVKTVIQDFIVYDASSKTSRVAYKWDKPFEIGTYNYTWYVPDAKSGAVFYAQATRALKTYSFYVSHKNQTTTASYADTMQDWVTKNISNAVDSTKGGTSLGNRIVAVSGQSNELKMQVRRTTTSGITYYQKFVFDIVKILTLADLSISTESAGEIGFVDGEGNTLEFDRDILEYIVKIGSDTQKINLSGTFQNTDSDYSFDGGYYATVNGIRYDDMSNISIDLDVNKNEELIEVEVGHRDTKAVKQTYTIVVKKQKPIKVTFDTNPENALVYIVNQLDDKTIYSDDNGVFTMMPDVPYTYTVSSYGYKTIQEENFKLAELQEGEDDTKTIEVVLEKAPDPIKELPNYDAAWPTFRADMNGNGVVSYKTPIEDEDAVLYWASQIGEGYDTGATGCPILVDGYLFTYAGNAIVKVDTMTGNVVATGTMHTSSSFAINSPTYAEGMIFVGLSGGSVQAFNADTLESLWVYTDPKGGQPNCSIKYHNGYIYTGFWTGETKPANFVCIPVTDEDPTKPDETKLASWRYTHNGFYWAGAYASNDFVLVGTDDGDNGYTTGHASVLSFDPATGKLIDEIKLPGVGDLRSDIMYDEKGTGDYYFTTKGGYIYRLKVNADGTFQNLMTLKLYNYANVDTNPPMSTCTPVIYNGRAYVGVSGTGQFADYSGHNITVIDLASWSIAYTVRTQGYPQTSGLLTTAYEAETGYAYVYFVDNAAPGKIRVLADKPGQKAPIETTEEAGYDTAKVLFTPTGAQAQYAICSPIADSNGVIYFKNDSAYMMAVGPVIDKIEVTTMPEKTEYAVGDTFDKAGMIVTATYSNGTQKDITKYVTFSEEPLTKGDTEFTITFPYVMYQDKDGQTGVDYPEPMTSIKLSVTMSVSTVESLIEAIGEVSLESEAAINEALEAYNLLSDEDKAKVSNAHKLTEARAALEQHKADKAAADVVIAQVRAIAPNPNAITLADEYAIVAAKEAFDALSDGAKAYFKANIVANNFMNIALNKLNTLKNQATDQSYADAVMTKINAIGEVTLNKEAKIEDARNAYDYLTDDQKALVTEETLKVLTDAEATLEQLKAAELAAAKGAAKADLTAYKNADDYREAEKAALSDEIAKANAVIEAATSAEAVDKAVADAKVAIDKIKTDAQLTAEELEVAKTEAKEEIVSYKNADDYREAEKTVLEEEISKANAVIETAENKEAVEKALADAKAAIDEIKTDAQYSAEEAASALARAKKEAKEEIAAYKNVDDYRDAEKTVLAEEIAKANAAIEAATSEEAVEKALLDAKVAIDKIKTDAELDKEESDAAAATLAKAKEDAKTEIAAYKNADDYRDAEKAVLAEEIAKAKAAIDVATSVEAVEKALADAKAAIDKIKTDAELDKEDAEFILTNAKKAAKAEIESYKNADDYRDAEKAVLAEEIAKAKAAIDVATSVETVEKALADAKAAIDKIKTDAELDKEEESSGSQENNNDGNNSEENDNNGSNNSGGNNNTGNSSKPSDTDKGPTTGDTTMVGFLTMMMVLAAIGIVTAVVAKRRRA